LTLHGSQNEPDAKIDMRNDASTGVLNLEMNKIPDFFQQELYGGRILKSDFHAVISNFSSN